MQQNTKKGKNINLLLSKFNSDKDTDDFVIEPQIDLMLIKMVLSSQMYLPSI